MSWWWVGMHNHVRLQTGAKCRPNINSSLNSKNWSTVLQRFSSHGPGILWKVDFELQLGYNRKCRNFGSDTECATADNQGILWKSKVLWDSRYVLSSMQTFPSHFPSFLSNKFYEVTLNKMRKPLTVLIWSSKWGWQFFDMPMPMLLTWIVGLLIRC